jgi:hypothetical protein
LSNTFFQNSVSNIIEKNSQKIYKKITILNFRKKNCGIKVLFCKKNPTINYFWKFKLKKNRFRRHLESSRHLGLSRHFEFLRLETFYVFIHIKIYHLLLGSFHANSTRPWHPWSRTCLIIFLTVNFNQLQENISYHVDTLEL